MTVQIDLPQKSNSSAATTSCGKLTFKHLTIVFGLSTLVIGALGIFAVPLGIPLIFGPNQSYRVEALSAALIWIFVGSVLTYHAVRPLQWTLGLVIQAILVLVAAAESLEFTCSILGGHCFIEALFVRAGTVIMGQLSSPISPAAAGLAVPVTIAVVFIIRDPGPSAKSMKIRDAIGILGLLISIISFTFVMSYAYGSPLIYGTQFIPIAFMSALAVFFAGAALVAAAGPEAFPIRLLIGKSIRARLLRLFVPLVICIIFIENVVFVGLSSWFNIHNAILLSVSLVIFIVVTAFVVTKVSASMGKRLEHAEQELVRKNEDLNALNEELTVAQEELRQSNDMLLANERQLAQKNEDLNALNEELTVAEEELRQSNNELIRREQEVSAEKERLSSLINSISDEVWFADTRQRFTLANEAGLREFGLSAGNHIDVEKLATNLEVFRLDGSPRPVEEAPPLRALKGEVIKNQIEIVRTPRQGAMRYRQVSSSPVKDISGNIIGSVSLVRDITEQKQAEEELKRMNADLSVAYEEITAKEEELRQNFEELSQREQDLHKALTEKEVLLSEIHHRVKNNLTAFISLLSLEGSIEDSPAGKMLRQDLQNRARSMALIHETLYRTNRFDEVDLGVYLGTLVNQVAQIFRMTRPVKMVVDVHGVMLDLPRATPVGLIVNELVTNSFKYAFPESFDVQAARGAPPTISVTLVKDDGFYILTVKDNGTGLPHDLDITKTKTLGLKLVNFLARHQLRATIQTKTQNGTEFVFRFRENDLSE